LKHVLVGVDGSDAAAAALGWAGRLARLVDAEVVVATAFRPDQAEVSPEHYEELKREAEHRLADEWSEPLRDSAVQHRAVLVAGAPDMLLDVAEREDADLIVVGPRGHGTFASLHIGSVAHYLANHTRRPLAIVPEPGAQAAVGRIVLGVDGSEGSDAAAHWCADLAGAVNAEVLAVYAFEPFVEWVPESDPRSWRQEAEREITEWVAPLRAAGVSVQTRIIKDIHPVAALAGAIDGESAGLAVVGTRGRGGFRGLRVGRVPIQLVHHTQMPMILVPAPTPDTAA
jgi:nucleotide-binding universal stress UspA family protein